VLDAIAQGRFDNPDVADQPDQALRLDRRRLVGTPGGSVQRDVPLDEAGPQSDGGVGRLESDFVTGVPDRAVELLPEVRMTERFNSSERQG